LTSTPTATSTSTPTNTPTPTPIPTAAIGNYVWYDADGNGAQGGQESGVNGVVVTLLNDSGQVLSTTATSSGGYYSFSLPAGTYIVSFTLPGGYLFAFQDALGTFGDPIDSDADQLTGATGPYVLTPGQVNLTVAAGLVLAPTATPTATATPTQTPTVTPAPTYRARLPLVIR